MGVIWMFEYLVQNPGCGRGSCQITYVNGTVEDTGLYGNCQYLDRYINQEYYDNLKRSDVIWNLEQ